MKLASLSGLAWLLLTLVHSVRASDRRPCDSTVQYSNKNMIDYKVKSRHLRGRVVDGTGLPMPKACVAIFNTDHSKVVRTVESAEDGSFAIADVPSGNYWLVVRDQQRAFCPATAKLEIGHLKLKNKILVMMMPSAIDTCSFCKAE